MSEDQRRARRIGKNDLPVSLQSMILMFDTGEEVKVETIDASSMGLGVMVPLNAVDFEENLAVLLRPEDGSYQLLGEVMFVAAQGENACRLGVQFSQTIAVKKYVALLAEAEEALS